MCRRLTGSIMSLLVVAALLLTGAGLASAHVSPAGCNSNDFVLNLTRDKATAHVGDVITYTVADGNPNSSGSACDVDETSVIGTRPNGTTVSLGPPCTGSFSGAGAGTPTANCGSFTYTVAAADVNPVTQAVTASVTGAGCLHDTAAGSGTSCSPDDPESITKTATVAILHPDLAVTKQCQDAVFGSPIPFNGTVTNTGNTTLTVVCTDNQAGLVFSGPLAAGASAPYSGSYNPSTNPSTDTVTCTGTDSLGGTVTASASAQCNVLCSPAISVAKTCVPSNTPDNPVINFSGTVTNSGNVPLTNVTCTDNQAGTVLSGGSLPTNGSSANYAGSYTAATSPSVDTVTCTGAPPAICNQAPVSNSVSATCTVNCSPSFTLTKVCQDATGQGQPITFSGTITNTGNATLTLSCTDTANGSTGPLPGAPGSLPPGGVATYSGSYVPASSPSADTAGCTGTPPAICNVSAITHTATATCQVPQGAGICRTPGFWGNHACGTSGSLDPNDCEKVGPHGPKAFNITQLALDRALDKIGAASLIICGEPVDNTKVPDQMSALEAICVRPSLDQNLPLQVARQLMSAALNCAVSDNTPAAEVCDGTSFEDVFHACNAACASAGSHVVTADVGGHIIDCGDALDCLNNGQLFDPATRQCGGSSGCHDENTTLVGACTISGVHCSSNTPCPPGAGQCKEGAAGSPNACHAARTNNCTIFGGSDC